MSGRAQERVHTGKTYALAEFLNSNWSRLVSRSNQEVAEMFGFKSGNMISMWRTGKTRVALEHLPELATLMKLDVSFLLPMWFEQYMGERKDAKRQITTVFNRFATQRQSIVLDALKRVAQETPGDESDPSYDQETVRAIEAVVKDKTLRAHVIKEGEKKGVLKPLSSDAEAVIAAIETPTKSSKAKVAAP